MSVWRVVLLGGAYILAEFRGAYHRGGAYEKRVWQTSKGVI